MRDWVIPLPWEKPPLSLNQRLHWRVKHQWTKVLRQIAAVEVRRHGIPGLVRCRVQLAWAPPDRRVRDEDNLVATLKPLCDGLVDAGVVPDDGPAWMDKPTPMIVAPRRPPVLWLVVSEVSVPSSTFVTCPHAGQERAALRPRPPLETPLRPPCPVCGQPVHEALIALGEDRTSTVRIRRRPRRSLRARWTWVRLWCRAVPRADTHGDRPPTDRRDRAAGVGSRTSVCAAIGV